MDEDQNATTDLSPINTALENLFLVFILSYTLFIPLKKVNPHKKMKTKQEFQANKTPKQWKPTNKTSPKPKQKNPHQNQNKNCKDNFCSLSFI